MKTTLTPQQNKMATFLRKETEGDDVEASVAPPGIQSNGQSSDAEMSDFNREGLAYHNECRRRHGVPPLVYNSEVKMVSSCMLDSPTDAIQRR
ncbi:hypothetical protein RUM43_011641 [Polyplax serrata]|uniref:SCP domain-containing protein n=1 Tax=Polyplax serrata TaxID=468196 RepID=A0AAN8NYF8_POLSC